MGRLSAELGKLKHQHVHLHLLATHPGQAAEQGMAQAHLAVAVAGSHRAATSMRWYTGTGQWR